MKADDPTLQELGTLLAALVDVGLSADQRARLNELLRDNPQAKHFYHRYIELHAMLEWESGVVATHHTEPDTDTLSDLLRMESQAQAELVHHLGQLRSRKDSPWHPAGALRWVIQRPTALAGIAAVMALALVLTALLGGLGNNTPTPQANNTLEPNKRAESVTPILRDRSTTPVATLTAQHHAQWSGRPASAGPEHPLKTGSKLHPGTRLTLTQGFAEITTARGAIAIIEAPATIELLDNDNAIRLHTGKLVGNCETESSKGFVVRTPHMDITDLGTRFGVDASQDGATEVHVFEGEVLVERRGVGDAPAIQETLLAGAAIRADTAGEGLAMIDSSPTRFAAAQWSVNRDAAAPADSGVTQITGQIKWLGDQATARSLRDLPASDDALVFEEVRGHKLGSALPVYKVQPGSALLIDSDAQHAVIPKGTVVRSYIVVFSPRSSATTTPSVSDCDLRFEGEVLGVVADEAGWRAFAQAVPGRLFELDAGKSIFIEGGAQRDTVALSPDRRGLSLRFLVSSGTADIIRVIVAEP